MFRVSRGCSVCRGDLGDAGSGGCLVDEVLAGAGGRDEGGDGDVVDGPWLAAGGLVDLVPLEYSIVSLTCAVTSWLVGLPGAA